MQTQDQQAWIEEFSQSEAEDCLRTLRGLADLMRSAMDSIVQRSLSSLQNTLHLQQISCSRLADLRHRSVERLKLPPTSEWASVDSDLALEIRAATESLLVLNSNYSALLKHSGDTLRLLAGLYRSYRGFSHTISECRATLPAGLAGSEERNKWLA